MVSLTVRPHSALPLTDLAAWVLRVLAAAETHPVTPNLVADPPAARAALQAWLPALQARIQLLAARKPHGMRTRDAVLEQDVSPHAVWRWEVALTDALPRDFQPLLKELRRLRKQSAGQIGAVEKVLEVLGKGVESPLTPAQLSKLSKLEENVRKFQRSEEAARLKLLERERKVRGGGALCATHCALRASLARHCPHAFRLRRAGRGEGCGQAAQASGAAAQAGGASQACRERRSSGSHGARACCSTCCSCSSSSAAGHTPAEGGGGKGGRGRAGAAVGSEATGLVLQTSGQRAAHIRRGDW